MINYATATINSQNIALYHASFAFLADIQVLIGIRINYVLILESFSIDDRNGNDDATN